MKKLCVLLVLALMLSLCACQEQETDSRRREKDKDHSESQTESLKDAGYMGWAVDTGLCTYYWQYAPESYDDGALMSNFSTQKPASLVRRDRDGNETVVLEGNGGEFAVAGGRIYYQDEDFIRSVDLDGSDPQELTAGALIAVDQAGQYLIICLDQVYHSYSIEKDQFTSLVNGGTYEGFHDGVVYYTTQVWEDYDDPAYEQAQNGMVTLRAVNVDGTDDRHLVTTEPDLYKFTSGYSPASVQQIRFGADGVYFSYGSIAGSGGFFQGGKILRVAYDGSGAEVVAGQTDLVDANFGIRDDGTVCTSTDQDFVYYEGHSDYYVIDGGFYWMDQTTGMARKLLDTSEYSTLVESQTCSINGASLWGDRAVFMVNYSDLDPSQAVGWRDYMVRIKTVVYQLDLETDTLTELYSF